MGTHVPLCVCRLEQTCGNPFFSFHTWVPGITIRWCALAPSAFPRWAFLPFLLENILSTVSHKFLGRLRESGRPGRQDRVPRNPWADPLHVFVLEQRGWGPSAIWNLIRNWGGGGMGRPLPHLCASPLPRGLPPQQLQLGPCEPKFPWEESPWKPPSLTWPGGVWAPPFKSALGPLGRPG